MDDALRELEDLLPGLNYVVSFDLRRVPFIADGTPEDYVMAALGPKVIISFISEVTSDEMLTEVEQCIRWEGEGEGTHPNRAAIHSPRLNELVSVVRAYLKRLADFASIWKLSLKEGHPYYPVQWEFAYVFVLDSPHGAEVFIGSSSD